MAESKVKFLEADAPKEIMDVIRKSVGKRKLIMIFKEKDFQDDEEFIKEFQKFLKGMFIRKKPPFEFEVRRENGEMTLTILTKKSVTGFSESEVSFYYQIINAYYPIREISSY